MVYNDRWTREKFLKYRELKRSGYTHGMLKEHFGDDIYFSGLYSKYPSKLSFLKKFNEISINPIETPYKYWMRNSYFYDSKTDYYVEFEAKNGNKYILGFIYFEIENIPTYNLMFTTEDNFKLYDSTLTNILSERELTDDDMGYLKSIFEKETDLVEIFYDLFKRLSFIIFDMYNKNLKINILSIGDTDNKRKIKFYRNIIKDSFKEVNEDEMITSYNVKYYIYKLNE